MEGVKNDWLLNALLNNQEFKTQLKDTMTNMAEVTFEKEATDTAIDSATKKMKKSAVSTYERFIAASTDTFYSDETDAIKKFFETRADYILKYTDEVIKQLIKYIQIQQQYELIKNILYFIALNVF